MQYFSDTYFESREKFRQLVQAHPAQLVNITHPDVKDPEGETLTVDYAVFGQPYANKVFFNLNGVHGNESYSGGAAQLQLIDSGVLDNLPQDVAVILVHNINPYGWAFDSQLNENGVNLNRNFVDFDHLPPTDELHLEIEKALRFEAFTMEAVFRAGQRMEQVQEAFGEARLWSVMMTGQYKAPRGVNYGGDRPAWSNEVLRRIAKEHLANAEKVALIDWHTGVGDYGEMVPLHIWEEGSEAWKRLSLWWGEDVVRRGSQGVFSGGEDQANSAAINGMAQSALYEAAPNARFCGGVIEFGTVSVNDLFLPVVIDSWLQFEGKAQGVDHRQWKSLQHYGFAPCDPFWRKMVLEQAADTYRRTIEGLIEW